MLIGEYRHNIDDKGRLIIPSKFRDELGDAFYITRGLDKCLFVYSTDKWLRFVKDLDNLNVASKDARAYTRILTSGAAKCEFDRQGRVNITSPLVSYADLTKECVIIGVNDRLEVWSKERWDEFLNLNEDNFENIAENLFTGKNETL